MGQTSRFTLWGLIVDKGLILKDRRVSKVLRVLTFDKTTPLGACSTVLGSVFERAVFVELTGEMRAPFGCHCSVS